MRLASPLCVAAALAACGLAALAGPLFAQTGGYPAPPMLGSERADFEQRAVRRGPSNSAPLAATSPYRGRTWGSAVQPTAYAEPLAPAPEAKLSPVPAPSETIQGALDAQAQPAEGFPMGAAGLEGAGCAACGDGCGGCCPRGGDAWCDCQDDDPGPFACCRCAWLRNFTLLAGVQGFKNAADQGASGNFGVHEGFNGAGPLGQHLFGCGLGEIGWQAGLLATQNNFAHTAVAAPGADQDQVFATVGLFRRALCGGLQWSLAFDFLHDQYYETVDMKQLRTEVGFVLPHCGEIGFWGAFGLGGGDETDATTGGALTVTPLDVYCFFLRRYFSAGGEGRLWLGITGNRDTLIGGDMEIPLGPAFSLVNSFNYMIPEEGGTTAGQARETWSVAMHLVWYPGRSAMCAGQNPFRPILPVADNTYFLVDRGAAH